MYLRSETHGNLDFSRTKRTAGFELPETVAGCLVHNAARWEAKNLVSQLKSVQETVKGIEKQMEAAARNFHEYE